MNRIRAMLVNTAMLTGTSLLMRSVAMVFQVWLSNRIGAAGIGLFQLIMSVSALAATFAISGIRFATTRLVAIELGAGSGRGVRAALRRCLAYSAFFGCAACVLLWFGAPMIGQRWIGDERTILSLRVLSLSLTFLSLAAVLSGYFTAVCRVVKSAATQIAEQAVRIGVIVFALGFAGNTNLELACAIIVAGGVAGEIASFIMLYSLYLADRRHVPKTGGGEAGITRRMFGIAVPLALSAYARTALNTLQNLLVPRGFRKSGASSERSLAEYGMITGMVFPIITFPAAVFQSLSEMLVPELTDAEVKGDRTKIKKLVGRSLTSCLVFSVVVMTVLIALSEFLGRAVYKNAEVGRYIRLLSWLVPIMYVDSVTDGMLRGLGLQVYSMGVNIADSLLSVALVWFLLPRYGVAGYIFMIYFTEAFNFILSMAKLIGVMRPREAKAKRRRRRFVVMRY